MVYHDFVENWFSHSSEKFPGGTLNFSENFLYRKSFWIGGGYHDSLRKFFCLTIPKKIAKRTVLFQKNSGLKKLHKMVYHDFVENWFSQSTEIFVGEPFFFRNFPLSKRFLDRRGISRLSLETFCLTVPKKFVGGPFFQKSSGLRKLHKKVYHDFVENWFSHSTAKLCGGTLHFSEIFFYWNFLWLGGGYHDLLSIFFCLTVPEELLGGPFFQKNSGIKILHKMVYHDFVENRFSQRNENFRRGLLQFSEKFIYRKVLWIGRGYHEFLSKLFCLTVPKKLVGGRLCFRKLLD